MLSQLQDNSQPWLAKKRLDKIHAREQVQEIPSDPTKSVEWYQPTVKSLPGATVEVFENYVGIKGEEAIKKQIYEIRDMAWRVTIQDLFQDAYNEAGAPEDKKVHWKVTSSLSRYASAAWDDSRRGWQGDETKQMMFTAVRL